MGSPGFVASVFTFLVNVEDFLSIFVILSTFFCICSRLLLSFRNGCVHSMELGSD